MLYLHNPLHSSNGLDSVWNNSKLSLKFKNRKELYKTLTNAREWNEICLILNDIPKNDIRSLATVLNDCPQWARVIALKQLKSTQADYYQKCMSVISEYQINKAFFDPENTFPYVATNQFFKCFKEGDTLAWTQSQIKSQDYSIYHIHAESNNTSKLENVAAYSLRIFIVLECIAEQLLPSDIINLLVAIGHVPTNRWRRKYINLFRQLPEHCEWIKQMKGKEYDIMLVGSDVRKLGLHISNSFKYPLDTIIVWLAVVPAAQYWRNYNDRSLEKSWRLYSDGNIYQDELMNDDEMGDIVRKRKTMSLSIYHWHEFYRPRKDFEPQNNMFATPTRTVNKRHFKYIAPDSNWAYTHDTERYPIKVLFYVGTKYRPASGTQLAVARLHREIVQSGRPRSFHPPLIRSWRGIEAPLLYYYKLTDMELRLCPQTQGLLEASGNNVILNVKLISGQFVSFSIPLNTINLT